MQVVRGTGMTSFQYESVMLVSTPSGSVALSWAGNFPPKGPGSIVGSAVSRCSVALFANFERLIANTRINLTARPVTRLATATRHQPGRPAGYAQRYAD